MADPIDIPKPVSSGAVDAPNAPQSGSPGIPEPPAGSEVYAVPPPPQGATEITSVPQQNPQTVQPEVGPSPAEAMSNEVGDVLKGAGKGLLETTTGLGKLLKHTPQIAIAEKLLGHEIIPESGLKAEEMTAGKPENTPQWIGYGGENLAEFMLGDEALKGLSMADKFKQISGVMGILEKSPRLMRAIQMGVDLTKAGGQLGADEIAAVKKSPLLARLVGTGMDALRQGAVQGAQTAVKTGGDVKKAAEEGATTGVASGVLGGAFGVLGRAAEKAGETGAAVKTASEEAGKASTKAEIGGKLANKINDAEQAMHGDFEAGIQKLTGDLKDAKVPYQESPLQKAAQEALQGKTEAKGVLGGEFQGISGGSNETKNLLGALADEKKTGDLSIDELVQRRQQLGEKIGQLTRGATSSADRADVQVYQKLRDGIDDTIQKLAESSGKPEAAQDYQALRGAYKDKVKLFNSPALQAMSAPGVEADQKLDNAAKYLLSGGNKLDKVATLEKAIGPEAVKSFGQDYARSLMADATSQNGQINPAKFVKEWKKIEALPPEVKTKLFDLDSANDGLGKLANDVKSAANYQKLARGGILGSAGGVTHGWGLVLGLLGHADMGRATELLDKVANSPSMWKSFEAAGKAGKALEASPAARQAGTALKYGTGNALSNIIQGASAPLSQNEQGVYENQ